MASFADTIGLPSSMMRCPPAVHPTDLSFPFLAPSFLYFLLWASATLLHKIMSRISKVGQLAKFILCLLIVHYHPRIWSTKDNNSILLLSQEYPAMSNRHRRNMITYVLELLVTTPLFIYMASGCYTVLQVDRESTAHGSRNHKTYTLVTPMRLCNHCLRSMQPYFPNPLIENASLKISTLSWQSLEARNSVGSVRVISKAFASLATSLSRFIFLSSCTEKRRTW
jgi:hypothetical protein